MDGMQQRDCKLNNVFARGLVTVFVELEPFAVIILD